ncbi:MAG: GH116 family glycosyl-hydrolase [Halobacteriaceae archaeon]
MDPDTTESYDDLYGGAIRRFSGTDTEFAFPLGGVGTGNVWLGSRGQLTDWELGPRPGKGNDLPWTFFALRCGGEEPVVRVLESRVQPPYYDSSRGFMPDRTNGLPRFESATITPTYPVVEYEFADSAVPVDVSLRASTPFVPLDPEASGIPGGVLAYTVENPTDRAIEVSLAGSMANPVGYFADDEPGRTVNRLREGEDLVGVEFTSDAYDAGDLEHGEATLAAEPAGATVSHTAAWPRGWQREVVREVWEDFRDDGAFEPNSYDEPSERGHTDVGSLALSATLAPGASRTFRFLLSWYVPNRRRGWDQSPGEGCCGGPGDGADPVRTNYATRFGGAWDAARHLAAERERLRERTDAFREAFFGSPLPGHVLEAVSTQLAVLRTHTVQWLADGTVLGYEGCNHDSGCCPGTCTHVWNYAQSLAAFFPSLEREMRRTDFEGVGESGYMPYRTPYPPAGEVSMDALDQLPAADGQFGAVLRLYREWQYSGDDAFLAELWPHARRALEFAFEYDEWDPDEEGVVAGEQHNTYDIEYHGPNPLTQTWYLGALRAGAEMARAVGDDGAAERYERVFESGRQRTEALYNGEYYEQAIEDPDAHPHQVGEGCLSDQVIGQWYADMLGLGDLLDPDHVASALDAVYEHNFRSDLSEHENLERVFALNDESGLLLCSWPRGGKPEIPTRFGEEVWTGIEYQVAAHLVYRGRVERGLELVRAARERFDGRARNPFNEFECGDHYARATANWAVYCALAGLHVDLRDAAQGLNDRGFRLDPAIDAAGEFFWITGDAWGTATPGGDVTVRHER